MKTRIPALNRQKKLGSQRICRVLDFFLLSSIIKKIVHVLCMCDGTVTCIMSLNDKISTVTSFEITPEVISNSLIINVINRYLLFHVRLLFGYSPLIKDLGC